MNDSEARKLNLPGSDVYKRDQICYLDDVNRKVTVARLLRAGYILFSNTPIVRHYKHGVPIDFYTWFFTNEYIVDLVRMQICYEHYLKSRFLLAGFVVHHFKQSQRSKELFRTLRDPKTQLVLIEDLRRNAEFTFQPEKQYNEIEELSDKTLGFTQLMKHRTIHSIPENVLRVLGEHNRHRNMLHFTEAQPLDFYAADIKEVIGHVDTSVRPMISLLAEELNLPNIEYGLP